jgi:hypothetical protein
VQDLKIGAAPTVFGSMCIHGRESVAGIGCREQAPDRSQVKLVRGQAQMILIHNCKPEWIIERRGAAHTVLSSQGLQKQSDTEADC